MKVIPDGAEHYARLLQDCVGRELLAVRQRWRWPLSEVAIPEILSGQAVRDHELGKYPPTLRHLCLHCWRLQARLERLLPTAIQRWWPQG